MASGPVLIVLLILAILFIIFGTAKVKMHPFLVLLITGYGLGLLAGLSPEQTIQAITEGFGGTLRYIGIVIAAGTIIGAILERSGAAHVMAESVIRWVGRARSVLAMSLTGAVVSIPVFCDSGYVVLSPLSRSLAAESKQSLATFAVALSMGLYATHVFVPPTPGPIAAAGELGADIGAVILLGLVTTIPVIATTYLFARYMGRRIYIDPAHEPEEAPLPEAVEKNTSLASWKAFAPIVVPVLLIAVQSVADLPGVVVRAPARGRSIGPAELPASDLSGHAVLFRTGWSRHWATPRYFEDHPFVSAEAAEALVKQRVALVGIDSLNVDATDDGTRPVHTALLRASIPVTDRIPIIPFGPTVTIFADCINPL